MKSFVSIIVGMMIFLIVSNTNAQNGCVTVRVTDESGQVISNALVDAGFGTWIKPGWGWGGGRPNIVKWISDTNGLCVLEGKGDGGDVGVAAGKEGYYGSDGYSLDFTNISGVVWRKWQPWNPTVEIVLKRVGNPIPMFARKVDDVSIPAEGVPVGFDLMKGDWVTPHGKGETPDFFFRLDRKPEVVVTNRYGPYTLYDVTLTISFSNDGDGIQSVLVPPRSGRSNLRLPATAPESGYVTNVVKRMCQEENKPSYSDVRADQNYFFRVRTKKNEEGKIVSALYGKIHGDFDRALLESQLRFTYYLNPTPNDRNMEFDPKRNLFENLSSLEEIRDP